MSTNKAILHGFVGKDPELKVLPNGGTTLCRFSLATTESWKDKDGVKQSKTEWHNIVAWNKQAEAIDKFVKKGTELIVEGKIEYTSVADKNDASKKVYFTSIKLEKFDFCGKKEGGQAAPDPEPGYQSESGSGSSNSVDDDTDIPF